MWNETIEFEVALARPRAGVRFEENNEYVKDLNEAVDEVNQEWNGDREFEILEYNGITVKIAFHSLDPIRAGRTLTRYLQKVSKILAYEKGWNEKVTRKEGTIFTVTSSDRGDELFDRHKDHSHGHGKYHHEMLEDDDSQKERKNHGFDKGKEGHERKGHHHIDRKEESSYRVCSCGRGKEIRTEGIIDHPIDTESTRVVLSEILELLKEIRDEMKKTKEKNE